MKSVHVFDMDGTLIDSEQATLAAYRMAARELGYQMPEAVSVWGHTAGEWHCPPDLHARKVELYAALCAGIESAWAAPLYVDYSARASSTVRVFTGASHATVSVLQRHALKVRTMLNNVRAGMSIQDKIAALQGLHYVVGAQELHYYDDDLTALNCIASRVEGLIPHAKESTAYARSNSSSR